MKCQKNVDDLVRHIYKIYKEPCPWWSKAHFRKRCIQIHAAETVLLRCLDAPFGDPRDVIDGYLMEICYMEHICDNKNVLSMLTIIEETLEDMLRYLS